MSNREPDGVAEAAAEMGAEENDAALGAFRWTPSSVLDYLCLHLYEFVRSNFRFVAVAAVAFVVLTNVTVGVAGLFLNPIIGAFTFVSLIPALFVAVYVWDSNPADETFSVAVFFTYLLGVLFVGLAYVLNTAAQGHFAAAPVLGTALFFFLFVAPVEEALKLAAVYLSAYDTRLFRGAIDGAAYGAFAALGFVTAENALYLVTGGVLGETPFLETLIGRAGLGPAHVIWSAVAGYYLGLAKTTPEYTGPVVLKGFLIASVLHASYNTFVTYQPALVEYIDFAVSPTVASIALNAVFLLTFYAGIWYFLETLIRRYRRAYAEHGLPTPETSDSEGSGASDVPPSASVGAVGVSSLVSFLRR